MSKILVTGGAGFIGSNLVDRLILEGHEVCIVDDMSSGREDYLNPQARFYDLEISSEKLASIFEAERFDFVYHLAAQIDVRRSVAHPVFDNLVNIIGGFNVIKTAHEYGVKKIIFVSTREVYGQNYVVLRFSNVYGPRQYKGGEAGIIANFVEAAVKKSACVLNGDGLQTRDFLFVYDAVDALVQAKEVDFYGEMNISTGREVNMMSVIAAIEKATGEKLNYQQLPGKLGEQRRSCLSYQKAHEILGYEPKIDLQQGIQLTVEWAKKQL
ncbi:MAG: NAD-dependent epimerase/dehydratase family protein [Candidatus Falkowbacteria bacterium]|nr:NAD-dependent epimerase/dehydratase family protein [Candidatus Falkowbacteria bacterium]